MLSLVLISGIPFQYHITQFEIILLGSYVINFLDALLNYLGLVIHLLSVLLKLDHLIDPPLNIVRLYMYFLQQLHNMNTQIGGENNISSIYQLIW
jgi:hypothetical protein